MASGGELDLADVPLDGPQAVAVATQLRNELRNPRTAPARRQRVASVLARIGSEASAAVADLEAIVTEEPSNRRWALKALAVFGEESASAVDTLIDVASDRTHSIDVRLLATEAMARSASQRPEVVRWFYETLKDRSLDPAERRSFISMSRVLGPVGGPVTPTLIQYLEATDFQTRFLAAESLGYIGSPLALEPLMITALNNDDPIVADAAAISINQLPGRIEKAFQKLIEIGDPTVRIRVARAWKRPSNARTASLKSLLADESEAVQVVAAYELLSADKSSALNALKRLSGGGTRAAREARKTLRGIEVGRAKPPACRPE